MILFNPRSPDWLSSLRQLIDYGNVHLSVRRNRKRPGYRGGGHCQNVRIFTFFSQCFSLINAETVLFIGNDKSQLFKNDRILNQSMSSDQNIDFLICKSFQDIMLDLCLGSFGSRQKTNADTKILKQITEFFGMLLSQNFSRSHQSSLKSGSNCSIHRNCRNYRFPASDVALQESIHMKRTMHVLANFVHDAFLCICQFKGKC